MGRAARLNPRSDDGRKWGQYVTAARLEQAPLSTLLKSLVATIAPAVASHFRLVDQHGRPIYSERDTRPGVTVRVKTPRRYEGLHG